MNVEEGPSVNSTIREERIAARAERIKARVEAQQVDEGGDDATFKGKRKEEKEVRKGKAQIHESRQKLDKLKTDGIEKVTFVRVEGDDRENARRVTAETRRQERRQKLLYEAESSAKRNAVVAMRWSQLFERDVPLELLKDMEVQKDACDRIIQVKEELIREFQQELKTKDDEYVKALKKQAEDIDRLLYETGKHYAELRKAYEEELEEIEIQFMHERLELMQHNQKEMFALSEKRRNNEGRNMEMRMKRIEEDQNKLERLRVQNVEDFNNLKIKLETETQKLEQTLQEMRATYQLNTEKLEYNYRVLYERDKENSTTITQQKRKLSRLQDQLSGLMQRYMKTDKAYKAQNLDLSDEYRRVTAQFKDLQAKFRHFEHADGKRYKEVWEMNEDLVLGMMEKVLTADKIVHEQQLGLFWFPPDYDAILNGFRTAKAFHMNRNKKKHLDDGPAKIEVMDLPTAIVDVLRMLVDEAGFLMEGKLPSILADVPTDEQNKMRMDAVLKALGIEAEDSAQQLLKFFVKPKDDDEPKPDGADADEASELVDQEDIVAALKTFVEESQRANPVAVLEMKKKAAAPSADRQASAGCWEMACSVISAKTWRIWQALEKALLKYNKILTERADKIGDCENLRNQNNELKMLLNQYLRAQVNMELQIPPTQTIAGLQGAG